MDSESSSEFDKGYDKGYEEGREEGILEGRDMGFQEGFLAEQDAHERRVGNMITEHENIMEALGIVLMRTVRAAYGSEHTGTSAKMQNVFDKLLPELEDLVDTEELLDVMYD